MECQGCEEGREGARSGPGRWHSWLIHAQNLLTLTHGIVEWLPVAHSVLPCGPSSTTFNRLSWSTMARADTICSQGHGKWGHAWPGTISGCFHSVPSVSTYPCLALLRVSCSCMRVSHPCLWVCEPLCLGWCPVPVIVCGVLALVLCVFVACTCLRVLSVCLWMCFVLPLVDFAVSSPTPQTVVSYKGRAYTSFIKQ